MKSQKKNKIIVSALALAIGASLAASVSSTIAWYQYSTRANISFIGQSSGFSGNLHMRFKGEENWRTRITWQEMRVYLQKKGFATNVLPMTYGQMERDDALPAKGYVQPDLWQSDMSQWKAAQKQHYAQFELELRYNERDGEIESGKDDKNTERKVYLSKLLIQEDANNGDKHDLSDAVRVHISSSYSNESKNKLISKNGGEIYTNGKLDLDGVDGNDKAYSLAGDAGEFGFGENNVLKELVYGEGKQVSYGATTDLEGGTKWTQDQIDAANAYDKTISDWKVEPVLYTQEEADELNATNGLSQGDPGYIEAGDVKTEGVHYTQEEIDVANAAHGKTIGDWKSAPVYYTQEEIDAAEAVHGITAASWKVDPVYYTQEEADAYNQANGLDSNDEGYVTTASIKTPGEHYSQAELDLANAYGKTTNDIKREAVLYTQEEADELNAASGLSQGDDGYIEAGDVKTEAVYFTQDEIDTANAYGKSIYDMKVKPTYFTREEVEVANDAYGKTTDDWRVEPVYPALAGITDGKLSNLDFDHDGDGDGDNATPKLDKFIGQTVESDDEYLSVKVTIWVEGWQELDGSAIWNEVKYVDSSFNVGIQFAVEDADF